MGHQAISAMCSARQCARLYRPRRDDAAPQDLLSRRFNVEPVQALSCANFWTTNAGNFCQYGDYCRPHPTASCE